MNIAIILLFIWFPFINCTEDKEINISTFKNFRRQVEEVPQETTPHEEDTSNIVSFLVQNVQKIFGSQNEPTVFIDTIPKSSETTASLLKLQVTSESSEENSEPDNNITTDKPLIEVTVDENVVTTVLIQDFTINNELLNLTKDLIAINKADNKVAEVALIAMQSDVSTTESPLPSEISNITNRKSCILCNNFDVEDCTDPKNKLIPSVVCDQEEDLCYSQHTPFGLIDRGCFNINRNVTTFACSCNLCNYIAISEMPHIFSSKRDWTENVIEMSRTKRFRQSIFSDMSCLRCEVNDTVKSADVVDSANCLEGNIGALPIEECAADEICGVTAIRSEGYIWRGCTSLPLYNYWWSLCDTDLCNYDALVSVYDDLF